MDLEYPFVQINQVHHELWTSAQQSATHFVTHFDLTRGSIHGFPHEVVHWIGLEVLMNI
jgi:hypothetical protein